MTSGYIARWQPFRDGRSLRPRGAFFPGAAPEPGWMWPARSMGPMANKEVRG